MEQEDMLEKKDTNGFFVLSATDLWKFTKQEPELTSESKKPQLRMWSVGFIKKNMQNTHDRNQRLRKFLANQKDKISSEESITTTGGTTTNTHHKYHVQDCIKSFWKSEDQWYYGTIIAAAQGNNKWRVLYNDGDDRIEDSSVLELLSLEELAQKNKNEANIEPIKYDEDAVWLDWVLYFCTEQQAEQASVHHT